MREEAVAELLRVADAGWEVVDKLIKDGSLMQLEYQRRKFYMRKLPGHAIMR